MARNNVGSVVGTDHEAEERSEAHGRCGTDDMQPGQGCPEGRIQSRRALETSNCTAQVFVNEFEAVDADIIARTGDDMIDRQLAPLAIIAVTDPKYNATIRVTCLDDLA